jgi:sulfotransferase family protein
MQPMSTFQETARGKRFIFVGGAEGSGTTLLRRVLASPSTCASHGKDIAKLPDRPDARPLFRAFEEANTRLWDRLLPLPLHEEARQDFHRTAAAMVDSPAFAECSHFIFKRSSPFGGGDQRRPDLFDVFELPVESRIVLIYRDPCAASYSALRRGFDTDLRRLALRCAEHLTWLDAQFRAVDPERVLLVSYRRLCHAPNAELERLSTFCGFTLSQSDFGESLEPDTDARYRRELPAPQAGWLESFFDARRRSQWQSLTQ